MNSSSNKGWKRIWLIISILYLGVVVVWIVYVWPNTKDIIQQRYDDTNELVGPHLVGEFEPVTDPSLIQHLNKLPEMTYAQKMKSTDDQQKEYKDKVNFEYVEERYEEGILAVNADRKQLVAMAVLIWIGPQIIFLLAIWAIGWVRQGFRNQ